MKINEIMYGVDYTYERTNCNGNCIDYCRCSSIINPKIRSIDNTYEKFVKIGTTIEQKYLLDRLYSIYKWWDIHNYEVEIGGGYYGEEVYGVTHCNLTKTQEFYDRCKDMSWNELIPELLQLEYTYLPNFLENVKYNIDIINPQIFDQQMVKSINTVLNTDIPIAIIRFDGIYYRIVDGHHRIHLALSKKLRSVSVLLTKDY
jgi:hypothetical protein